MDYDVNCHLAAGNTTQLQLVSHHSAKYTITKSAQ